MKNGRIDKKQKIQLGLHIREPGKKFDPKKSWFWWRGLHLKNMARAQRMLKENEVKIFKKRKMAKAPFLVPPKWPKRPLSIQTSPQNPKKDTLGTQIGPRKVIFSHFAFFWYIFLIFFEHSLSTGRIFQMQTPSSKWTFFWVKLVFPGFLMYTPSWIFSFLLIRPFFILGPRPSGASKWPKAGKPRHEISQHFYTFYIAKLIVDLHTIQQSCVWT